MHHPKVVQTLDICPDSGWIILELCHRWTKCAYIAGYCDSGELPMDLRIAVLADVIECIIEYLHSNDVVHSDIKLLNVLVCGNENSEFIFKVADYAS